MITFSLVRSASCAPAVTPEWLSQQFAPDLAIQLQRDIAPAWGLDPRGLQVDPTAYPSFEAAPAGSYVLEFVGPAPAPGDLAYHTEDSSGRVRAPIETTDLDLDTVSGGASHETLEATVDPHINLWVDFAPRPGWKVMLEIADLVQSRGYRVRQGGCLMSSFAFPASFDPFGVAPFDYLGDLSAPFTRIPGDGGDYMILEDPSGVRSQDPPGARLGRRALVALRGGR